MQAAFGSSPTILLVDDDGQVLDVARLILENAGYTVLAARNGQEAVALFEAHKESVDLLLTDINMPGISGLVLACRVTQIAPHLPVAFMTGCRPGSFGIEVLLKEGPFGDCKVIYKPFSVSGLLTEVTSIVSVTSFR